MKRTKIVDVSKYETWSHFNRYEHDGCFYSLSYLIDESCIFRITKSLSRI